MERRFFFLLLLVVGCATPPTSEQKYDQMVRPAVRISMNSGDYGSGVVYFSEDYTLIISAHHVTKNEEWLKVHMNGEEYDAEIVKEDEELDLSVLRVEAHTDYVAHMHDVEVMPFDEIFIVGGGHEYDPYPTMGIVSNSYNEELDLIQFSAPIVGGVSGGGMYRRHGQHYVLVGIADKIGLYPIFATAGGTTVKIPIVNIGWAIPIQVVEEFIEGTLVTSP